MRVLIVEDSQPFATLVAQYLQRAGFESDQVESIEQAERATLALNYAAIVLDLGLRDGDGMDFLRALRQRGDPTPVVITTARHGLEDRVRGLRDGADDYLAKPFSVDELVARLQAVIRRPGTLLAQVIRAGNVALDTESRQVDIAGQVQPMPLRLTTLLELLMRHLGSVVPRRYVEDQLFGVGDEPGPNTVEVYIHRLRRQLVAAEATVAIHTIRGVGHMMTEIRPSASATTRPRNGASRAGPTS